MPLEVPYETDTRAVLRQKLREFCTWVDRRQSAVLCVALGSAGGAAVIGLLAVATLIVQRACP